jgi:two-component system OmpR family response regulator
VGLWRLRGVAHRREQRVRVLVVDDDRTVRDAVVGALDAAGYATEACGSVDETVELATWFRPDLVVLEMVLGGRVVGPELGRRLRTQADVLLVFATRDADVEDRLAAFEAGGDDYLVKPFRVDELVMRARAVLRRAGRSGSEALVVGRLAVDERARRVVFAGAEVELGARGLALLAALARNAGQVVSKARLLDLVWGPEAVDENLVEVHISSLRRRLGPSGSSVIRTVRGVGYMLHDDTVDSGRPGRT